MIKKINLYLTLIILLFCKINLQATIQNNIIAKVDNEIISTIDLENELKIFLLLNGKKFSYDNISKNQKLALESLIRKKVKMIELKKNNFNNISEPEMSEAIKNITKRLNYDIDEIKIMFSKNNIDYDFFLDGIKIDFLWNKLIFKLYSRQLNINTYEVENEIQNFEKIKINKIYNLSEIVLTKESIKSSLTEIKKLNSENKFQDAVNQYSISETRNNNGSLGWIESSKLNSTYKMQLQGLKIGQLTKPIKVNEGFVVIRLNDIKTQRVEETDIEKIKNDIVIKMKNEKLNFYSRSHFNKVKNKSLIISK